MIGKGLLILFLVGVVLSEAAKVDDVVLVAGRFSLGSRYVLSDDG